MSTAALTQTLRIGEVAERTGVTPRTIRYYEEIGLLGAEEDRAQGQHRTYSEADVERIAEIVRLRDLLGLSLDQLRALLEAETARAELRREYRATEDPGEQARILKESLAHIGTQLELVRSRTAELKRLDQELVERRRLVRGKLRALGR